MLRNLSIENFSSFPPCIFSPTFSPHSPKRRYSCCTYGWRIDVARMEEELRLKRRPSFYTSLQPAKNHPVQLSDSRASLGIKKVHMRAPLKPLEHDKTMLLRGLSGALIWDPIMPKGMKISASPGIYFAVWTSMLICLMSIGPYFTSHFVGVDSWPAEHKVFWRSKV